MKMPPEYIWEEWVMFPFLFAAVIAGLVFVVGSFIFMDIGWCPVIVYRIVFVVCLLAVYARMTKDALEALDGME